MNCELDVASMLALAAKFRKAVFTLSEEEDGLTATRTVPPFDSVLLHPERVMAASECARTPTVPSTSE